MATLPIEFCRRVARERRARGLTQSALARVAGCKQSAVSMFECGHPEKLSMEYVRKIAEILEIPLESVEEGRALEPDTCYLGKKGYCPNPFCLSNIPYEIEGELVLWPALTAVGEDARYCRVCGEVLEDACSTCGSRIEAGAFCVRCGRPRITPVISPGTSPQEWITRRRAEITQWRELTDEKNSDSHRRQSRS